jgi:hypothetical protein
MKKFTLIILVSIYALVFSISSCQKENLANESSVSTKLNPENRRIEDTAKVYASHFSLMLGFEPE